jgi:hypothetical protein
MSWVLWRAQYFRNLGEVASRGRLILAFH